MMGTVLSFFFLDATEYVVFLSLNIFFQWIGLFYYLQALPSYGTLIRMIVQIFYDIRGYLVILTVTIVAFANALYLMFNIGSHTLGSSGYDTIQEALFSAYKLLLLSDFNDDEFVVGTPVYQGVVASLFVFVTLLGPVVLLNLLIAQMTDSYEKIQDEAEKEMRRLKARIILGFEAMMGDKNPDWFPMWVHVLLRKGQNIAEVPNTGWSGMLTDTKKAIKDESAEIRKETTVRLGKMEGKMNQMDGKMDRMEGKMDQMDGKMYRILELLSKVKKVDGKGGEDGDTTPGFPPE